MPDTKVAEAESARLYRIGRRNGYPIPIELYCRHKNLQASIRTLVNELQLVEAAIVEADRAHEAERVAFSPHFAEAARAREAAMPETGEPVDFTDSAYREAWISNWEAELEAGR